MGRQTPAGGQHTLYGIHFLGLELEFEHIYLRQITVQWWQIALHTPA